MKKKNINLRFFLLLIIAVAAVVFTDRKKYFITDQGENELMILYEGLAWEGTLTKDCDEGTLAWIPLAEIEALSLWEGDRLFMPALIAGEQDIRMKLVYEGDRLVFHERYL